MWYTNCKIGCDKASPTTTAFLFNRCSPRDDALGQVHGPAKHARVRGVGGRAIPTLIIGPAKGPSAATNCTS